MTRAEQQRIRRAKDRVIDAITVLRNGSHYYPEWSINFRKVMDASRKLEAILNGENDGEGSTEIRL